MRDPHAARRLTACAAALVIAWPMLALSEFKPWALFTDGNLAVIGGFLAGFFPPDGSPAFLALLLKATLETLAMATAGTALALLIGAPLGFVTTRALSISRIGPGPGRVQAGIAGQGVSSTRLSTRKSLYAPPRPCSASTRRSAFSAARLVVLRPVQRTRRPPLPSQPGAVNRAVIS